MMREKMDIDAARCIKWFDDNIAIAKERKGGWIGDLVAHRAFIDTLVCYVAELEQQLAKSLAFKTFVHKTLDAMGVPEDPDPEHNKQCGCRINGRLAWIATKLYAANDLAAGLDATRNDDRTNVDLS